MIKIEWACTCGESGSGEDGARTHVCHDAKVTAIRFNDEEVSVVFDGYLWPQVGCINTPLPTDPAERSRVLQAVFADCDRRGYASATVPAPA